MFTGERRPLRDLQRGFDLGLQYLISAGDGGGGACVTAFQRCQHGGPLNAMLARQTVGSLNGI